MTDYIKLAKEVIAIEAEAIAALADRLDQNFTCAVEAILNCQGRLIVAGMGKSGLIGKKISATFNSTGIPSSFLHPSDAMHGDLGLITASDVMLLISKSGQMGEIELLLATARRLGITIIGLCGTVDSELYKRADIPLDCSVNKEACPNNLVPTSSSTAALVMGDAIAIAMLKARNFTADDFAALHPGGFLGRRLVKLISELHHTGDDIPLVNKDATMKEMILMMTSKRLGCVVIKDETGKIAGIFTDGDLRRLAEQNQELFSYRALDVMIKNPKAIAQSAVLDAGLAIMEKHSISQLPTVDENLKLIGIIHVHDILKSKLV
ncbi:MAG: KpsF/GutQ family sugar-phosphate isomerase [candidate division Zixibacteria bacterium]|nr:KpsF/GutQ family sugar-phosphate isomerase [candidate division Zixibacteria bacterium]